MKNFILLSSLLIALTHKGFADDLLYKEYALEAGESISKLIYKVKDLADKDKMKLINESLRVNNLSKEEAAKLSVHERVLIPVSVYKYYEVEKHAIPAEMTEISDEKIAPEVKGPSEQIDRVTESSAAIQKVSTSIATSKYSKNTKKNTYIRLGVENTNLNTKDNDLNGDVRSLSLGIYNRVTDSFYIGFDASKDIAEDSSFASEDPALKFGVSYTLYSNDILEVEGTLSYESTNYNFEGLNLFKVGRIEQRSNLFGLRTSLLINDKLSTSLAIDYEVSGTSKNITENGLEIKDSERLIIEGAANYQLNDIAQLYFAVAREESDWDAGEKTIEFRSSLFKFGTIFAY